MQNGKIAFIWHVVITLVALGDTKSIIEFMIAYAYQLSRFENIVAMELLGFTEEIRDVIYWMKVLKRKSFPPNLFLSRLINIFRQMNFRKNKHCIHHFLMETAVFDLIPRNIKI